MSILSTKKIKIMFKIGILLMIVGILMILILLFMLHWTIGLTILGVLLIITGIVLITEYNENNTK